VFGAQRTAQARAENGATKRATTEAMFGDAFAYRETAYARREAEHDDGEDDALDAIKPTMPDSFRLP